MLTKVARSRGFDMLERSIRNTITLKGLKAFSRQSRDISSISLWKALV